MTDPRNISIHDYTYVLPEDRIAKYPLAERDASKLLIYKDEVITEDVYKNITQHIPENSLLVFNNTKVVEARLLFKKESGATIEIFCLEPDDKYADITTAMLQKEKVLWKCLVGGFSKWKHGQILQKKIHCNDKVIILSASFKEKRGEAFIIELSWNDEVISFAELLHLTGAIPLPPYIKRLAEESDIERYQTVYAAHDGSVAAPTAGLHFTENIFTQLKRKTVHSDFVTLHVGAGTFKPVKTVLMQDHEMHAEWIDVPKATIENIVQHLGKNIIAVGTTSLRTIESLYWMGVKKSGDLHQWEAYDLAEKNISPKDALESLLTWMEHQKLERLITKTQILIAPGYEFKIVDGLITNFHQPQSTLLLLVSALIGADWRKVYDHAMQHDFRFLSYGDGSLLWKKK
jgi:S-adenosylmethionine:tRNA ribosyltransferase-isomerase